jgi:hypothetical protein
MDFHEKICVLVHVNVIQSSSTKQQQNFDATTCLYEKGKFDKTLN